MDVHRAIVDGVAAKLRDALPGSEASFASRYGFGEERHTATISGATDGAMATVAYYWLKGLIWVVFDGCKQFKYKVDNPDFVNQLERDIEAVLEARAKMLKRSSSRSS